MGQFANGCGHMGMVTREGGKLVDYWGYPDLNGWDPRLDQMQRATVYVPNTKEQADRMFANTKAYHGANMRCYGNVAQATGIMPHIPGNCLGYAYKFNHVPQEALERMGLHKVNQSHVPSGANVNVQLNIPPGRGLTNTTPYSSSPSSPPQRVSNPFASLYSSDDGYTGNIDTKEMNRIQGILDGAFDRNNADPNGVVAKEMQPLLNKMTTMGNLTQSVSHGQSSGPPSYGNTTTTDVGSLLNMSG
jgi:hypothetical protein